MEKEQGRLLKEVEKELNGDFEDGELSELSDDEFDILMGYKEKGERFRDES